MFQSSARAPTRATTAPSARRSTALTGVLPKLVTLTTRAAAMANVTVAGSVATRATPGCSALLASAMV